RTATPYTATGFITPIVITVTEAASLYLPAVAERSHACFYLSSESLVIISFACIHSEVDLTSK
ncbi:hypothetical protein J6590_095824, partial [Homalodisca vitripennis]